MHVRRVESLSFHIITYLPVFNVPQFIVKLVIPPNYRLHRRWRFNEGALYRQTIDYLLMASQPSPLLDHQHQYIYRQTLDYLHSHSNRPHTITKMYDNINMDSKIAGSMNVRSQQTTSYREVESVG